MFGELCHSVLLGDECTLVSLALQYPLLTLVLRNPWDLRLAPLVTAWSRLEAPVAFAGARAQLLVAAICRAVTFLHQISL